MIISVLVGACLIIAFTLTAVGKSPKSGKNNKTKSQTTGTDNDNVSAGDE